MDKFGTASHCIYRKASGVTEHIENTPVLGIGLQQLPVLPLIDKETCFLSFQPINMEAQSVFPCYIIIGSTVYKAVFLSQVRLERQCCLTLVVNIVYPTFENFYKSLGYFVPADMKANAVSLHDRSLAIAINDKSRQIVSLAMNKTISVIVWIVSNADRLSHHKR